MILQPPIKKDAGTPARHVLKKRWSLATYLLPEEQAELSAQIQASGSGDWITIHPCIPADTNGSSPRENETLVVSRKSADRIKPYSELINAHLRGQRVLDVEQLLKEIRGRVNLGTADTWSFLLGSTYQSPSIRLYFYLKAFLEPILAILLLVLLSPVLLGLAMAIYVTSGRPIFYCQNRLGYHGKTFPLSNSARCA